MHGSVLTAALLALALAVAPVRAAELTVLAGGSMTASLKELGPRFEQATGHKLAFRFAGTPELIKLATSASRPATILGEALSPSIRSARVEPLSGIGQA